MGPMMKPIAESFHLTDYLMGLVTGGLTSEQAMKRGRGGEGASISWIVGHLLHYRIQAMQLLGKSVENPYQAMFSDGADAGSNYPDIAELRAQWKQVSDDLDAVMETATDDQLTAPVEGSVHGEKSALGILVFHMWHESYHMGALGAIRKELGLPATAELAMAAAQTN